MEHDLLVNEWQATASFAHRRWLHRAIRYLPFHHTSRTFHLLFALITKQTVIDRTILYVQAQVLSDTNSSGVVDTASLDAYTAYIHTSCVGREICHHTTPPSSLIR
jgi:hypothetical protein